ncbi:MAG: hypothetical protein IPL39_00930 [Opitutaceae bacterium]|nr:hypothetical protein [Opitutaceae bacterium]
MNTPKRLLLVSVGFLAALAACPAFAKAERTAAVAAEATVAASPVGGDQIAAVATKAGRSIQASPADVQTLSAARKSNDTSAARAVLLRNGFTAEQLAGAQIVVNEIKTPRDVATGQSSGQRVTVTITVRTKPLVITIEIRW